MTVSYTMSSSTPSCEQCQSAITHDPDGQPGASRSASGLLCDSCQQGGRRPRRRTQKARQDDELVDYRLQQALDEARRQSLVTGPPPRRPSAARVEIRGDSCVPVNECEAAGITKRKPDFRSTKKEVNEAEKWDSTSIRSKRRNTAATASTPSLARHGLEGRRETRNQAYESDELRNGGSAKKKRKSINASEHNSQVSADAQMGRVTRSKGISMQTPTKIVSQKTAVPNSESSSNSTAAGEKAKPNPWMDAGGSVARVYEIDLEGVKVLIGLNARSILSEVHSD
ncbi:hypothetical protein DFJ77DRAFT_449388 [Powellomyces hirtus]|nr:hypothetical protein DFJ77DRAFT_449388 [Powellomyces hirtus]